MTSSALDLYLRRIGSTPLLTRQEERSLARIVRLGREAHARIEAGEHQAEDDRLVQRGRRAHQKLFERNLKLVVSIARRYPAQPRLELIDLIQEGNLGLDHAITKFDERRGFKLSTYATDWIMNYISRICDRNVAIPTIARDTVAALRIAMRDSNAESVSMNSHLRRAAAAVNDESLDAPMSTHSDAGARHDYYADVTYPTVEGSALRAVESQRVVEEVMGGLDKRAQRAVVHRFGLDGREPMSLDRIARELGVSTKTAKRVLNESLQPVIERHAEMRNDTTMA